MSTSKMNGNLIYYDEAAEIFRYASDDEPINWNNHRPCPKCGKRPLDTSEDACLGHLPGVVQACCGHGGEGYIEFENGVTIHFRGCEIERSIGMSDQGTETKGGKTIVSLKDALRELRRIRKEYNNTISRLKQRELNSDKPMYIVQTKSTRDAYGMGIKHIAWLIKKIEESESARARTPAGP